MICDHWSVAVAPFPFIDNLQAKPRPILILSRREFNAANGHSICAMITTGAGMHWDGDVAILELGSAGLSVASVIRPKIFTLDNRVISKEIGALSPRDISAVNQELKKIIPS